MLALVIAGLLGAAVERVVLRPVEEAPVLNSVIVTLGLFTLFKTRDFSMHRAQFMIFITPRILEFAKDANSELKDYFNLQEVYPPKATTERGQ